MGSICPENYKTEPNGVMCHRMIGLETPAVTIELYYGNLKFCYMPADGILLTFLLKIRKKA